MDAITQLVCAADAYGAALGIERSTVSWRLFGDGKKLAALVDGADIQVRRFEAALSWLSSNWPREVDWPADVVRPHVGDPLSSDDAVVPSADVPGAEKNGAVFSPARGVA